MIFYDSIVDIIQNYVDSTALEIFNDKNCPPEFTVSIFSDDTCGYDKIMMTVFHCGVRFTDLLFPRTDSHYGYESIDHMMKDMYNRTM